MNYSSTTLDYGMSPLVNLQVLYRNPL